MQNLENQMRIENLKVLRKTGDVSFEESIEIFLQLVKDEVILIVNYQERGNSIQ